MHVLAGYPSIEDPESFIERLRATISEIPVAVQALDTRYVAGRAHLERSVELARRERQRGAAIADSLIVEVLCYAAGRRQIEEALTMGVDGTTDGVVVLVIAEEGTVPDPGEDGGTVAGENMVGAGENAPTGDGDDAHKDVDPALEAACDRLQERFDLGNPATDPTAERVLEATDTEHIEPFFDLTATERKAALATLPELVAERVALLVVDR